MKLAILSNIHDTVWNLRAALGALGGADALLFCRRLANCHPARHSAPSGQTEGRLLSSSTRERWRVGRRGHRRRSAA